MKCFYEVDKEMVSHVSDKICTGMFTAFLDTYPSFSEAESNASTI
jgi:hypothetical protein